MEKTEATHISTCVRERKTDREWKEGKKKVSEKATFMKQSSHSVIMLPWNNSSVDWIALVIAYSLLFPAELMKVGSQHQGRDSAEEYQRHSKACSAHHQSL